MSSIEKQLTQLTKDKENLVISIEKYINENYYIDSIEQIAVFNEE